MPRCARSPEITSEYGPRVAGRQAAAAFYSGAMRSYLTLFALSLLLGVLLTTPMMRLGRLIGAMDRTKLADIPRTGGAARGLAGRPAGRGVSARFAPPRGGGFPPRPPLAREDAGAPGILLRAGPGHDQGA